MTRTSLLFAALLTVHALPVWAQNKPAPASGAEKELPGRWEGTFRSDHAGGNIQLRAEQDKGWKVTLSMQTDMHEIPDQQLSNFKVDGKNITWSQTLMGGPCTSAAILEKGELKGETRCEQVHVSFIMHKK